jgi:cell wall-associated NlpC family hydrolase
MKRVYAVAISLAMLVAALVAVPGVASASPATNRQAIDYVIQRALSQRGVPFSYGGGNASGPSAGIVRDAPDASVVPDANVVPGLATVPGAAVAPTAGAAQLGTPQLGTAPAAGALPAAGAMPATGAVPSSGAIPHDGPVGFDASGLVQYAFAGVGIKLPRSSGEQYKVGRKITPDQALPGDLLFFGPDGTQSVALFLGNGQMLEASDSGVTVSPVRTNGMAPYLSRMIDWQ